MLIKQQFNPVHTLGEKPATKTQLAVSLNSVNGK